jgi:ribonucleoside-diphosphate reductase beta chain
MSVDVTPNYDLVPEGTVRDTVVMPHIAGESSPTMTAVKQEALLAIHELIPVSLRRPGPFKPMRYPWAYDLWKVHEEVHWLPKEVPLGEDVKDWERNLTPGEKNLLTQIFRLFVKSDEEVSNNYMTRLGGLFKPTEICMMLSGFAGREPVHIDAYSLVLETVGMPDSEYAAFAEYEAMKAKVDHWDTFTVDTDANILRTLAMFGGFAEGLQLFASFAMLMNFPRFNKMKGMGQIVSWSVRDESIHCEGIIRLFHEFANETGALTPLVKADILKTCLKVIEQEDAFIDLAFELGAVEGMTADDIKQYIRFIAGWRMRQLGLDDPFGITEHPLLWLQALLSGQEHANFFEARATEYSKGASGGTYGAVWDRFDAQRRVE